MNVYRRYFIIKKGPITKKAREILDFNDEAKTDIKEFLGSIGADTNQWYSRDNRIVGIIFNKLPDTTLFKKIKNSGWWPKKNTKKAKAIWQRLTDIKTMSEDSLLELVGKDKFPHMFTGGKCHYATCLVLPYKKPHVIISVPWYDEDPETVKADPKHELNWKPAKDMIEVREWEYLKAIDKFNETVKG